MAGEATYIVVFGFQKTMDRAMTERTYSFQCQKCIKKSDGTIGHYILEVTDTVDGTIEEIAVAPKDLISNRSMRRILLGRKILYSASQSKHEKMLSELFATKSETF
jgi:hypothetical protein